MKMYVSFAALMSVMLAMSHPVEALEDEESGKPKTFAKEKGRGREKEKEKGVEEKGSSKRELSPSPLWSLPNEIFYEILFFGICDKDIPQGCRNKATFELTQRRLLNIIRSSPFIKRYRRLVTSHIPEMKIEIWQENPDFFQQVGTLFSILKKGKNFEAELKFSDAARVYAGALVRRPNSCLLVSRLMDILVETNEDLFADRNPELRKLSLNRLHANFLGAARSLLEERKRSGEDFDISKHEILLKFYFFLKDWPERPLDNNFMAETHFLEEEVEKAKSIITEIIEDKFEEGGNLPPLHILRAMISWDSSFQNPQREQAFIEVATNGTPADKWRLGHYYLSDYLKMGNDYLKMGNINGKYIARAIGWYEDATKEGHSESTPEEIEAFIELGSIYEDAQPEEAKKLYWIAAKHGSSEAQFRIGSMYQMGLGH